MMKYIFGLTIISIFILNTIAYSQRIYQWEEDGVDNYSNNPAEVPYDLIYNKEQENAKSDNLEDQALAKLNERLDGPSKAKLKLILETETKLQNLITAKKKDLKILKNQKETPTEKVVELENFIFKAEYNMKIIRTEKDTFIKQNQSS